MNKHIVLTGATGFLGSRLLCTLLANGYNVIAIKRSTSLTEKIESVLDHPCMHLFDIDTQDPAIVFERFDVDTIIHVATEYGRGATPIYSILDANLILPLRLAELGMQSGVKCFINSDSFFNKGANSYSNLLNYSLSKKSLLSWLAKLAGDLKIVNVVLEHIYGPGDSPSKFVEGMVQQIAVQQAPHVALTHGHQVRDFVHVQDVATAYLKLVDYGRAHEFTFETFELGTGLGTQIRDFVTLLKDMSNSPSALGFGDIAYRSDEIMLSTANISKLVKLGWQPSIALQDGVCGILDQYGVLRHGE